MKERVVGNFTTNSTIKEDIQLLTGISYLTRDCGVIVIRSATDR